MTSSDDLADLLVPHWTQGAPPRPTLGVPGQPASYGQGVLAAWNPTTFENTVYFHGAVLENLPVMAGPDALAFRAGDVVGIMYWSPQGGSGQYWILPRIIVPGSDAAQQAIASMQTDIGRRVSSAVLADRIHSAQAGGQTLTSSTSFGDGSSGGPVISDVEITEAGLALVFVGCLIDVGPRAGGQIGGYMSFEVSGATSVAPSVLTAVNIGGSVDGASHRVGGRFMAAEWVPLNPGVHTFTARYASQVGGEDARFSRRTMIVVAF